MSQIRAEAPVRDSARNGMAVDARSSLKDPTPFVRCAISHVRLSFILNPLVELLLRVNVDAQEHLGVLHPAVLGALADINSDFIRIDPHVVDAIRNKIRLTRKPR